MNEDTFHLGIKALIQNSEGKILLLKANKALIKEYKGNAYWDIPGGRIQKGNSAEETLKREIQEETGIASVCNIKHVSMVLSNLRLPLGDTGDVGLILSVYSCKIPTKSTIALSKEHTEYAYFEPVEAAKLLEVKYPKEFTDIVKNLKQ